MIIKKLKLEDICRIVKTEHDKMDVMYLDYVMTTSPSPSVYPSMSSIQPMTKNFILNKIYTNSIHDSLLYDLIKNIKKKDYKGTYYEGRFYYDTEWLDNQEGIRKFISRILMLGNSVAVNGRIGPPTGIIFDPKNIKLFDKIYNNYNGLSTFQLFSYEGLGDKIIAFREPKNDMSSWILAHNDNLYDFQEVGDYSRQYDILSLSKLSLRKYKLERICSE